MFKKKITNWKVIDANYWRQLKGNDETLLDEIVKSNIAINSILHNIEYYQLLFQVTS